MREGWQTKKLGDICDILNGRNQKTVENPDGLYPIYGSGGIMGYADDFICKAGTTIIGRKGTINKPLFVDCAFWNVDTAFGLQPKEGTNPRFLFYTCKSTDFTRYNKSTTLPSLVKSDLLKIDLQVPPIAEQEKIVAELDCLTGIIEKKKQQLEELDKLAQTIFYDMFGDPITNEKGWEVRQMGTFCRCELGKMLDVKKNRGRLLPYLCSINVQWGRFDLSYLKEMRFEDDELERFAVKKRDLMICEGGDAGRCAIWNEDYSVFYQKALHRVRFNESVMLPIVCQFIMKIYKDRGEMDKYCKGQTIKHLVKEILISLPMITPPLVLQNEFAKKIEAIEKQKELVKRSIVETETLFNSRMDYWFN